MIEREVREVESIRFGFQCPDNGTDIAGLYEDGRISLMLNPNGNEGPDILAEATEWACKITKTSRARHPSWKEARECLIRMGVDPSDL